MPFIIEILYLKSFNCGKLLRAKYTTTQSEKVNVNVIKNILIGQSAAKFLLRHFIKNKYLYM
jgi:hypothetical protein